MTTLAALLKYSDDQPRSDDGRFSSAGDETGSGAPKPGEKFVVYRLGDKSSDLSNRNAGNSHAVAHHIARTQDDFAPQGKGGVGQIVTAHEITVGPKGFGAYALYNAGTGARSSQVGRAAGEKVIGRDNQITYSFPKGADYTSRLIGSVPASKLGDFDAMGSNRGAEVIRQHFTSRAGKVDLSQLFKYSDAQPRDDAGRWTDGSGAGGQMGGQGRVDAGRFPRAEPGSLTPRQVGVESRFASQLSQSIPAAERDYANLKGTAGGKILNTDLVRELSPDYRNDRSSLSPAVHEPASEFTKMMYANRLAEPAVTGTVLFTAGGAGSGKSSGIKDVPEMAAIQSAADVIYDTNMNRFGSAKQKIDQALASGRDVQIAYVARDPVESLVLGALPRAMGSSGGRTVPLVEHIATHVGAADTIQQLATHYADNPKVQIHYIDNTHGRGGAVISDASLPKQLNMANLQDRLQTALKGEYDAGRISTRVYEGTKGSDDASGP